MKKILLLLVLVLFTNVGLIRAQSIIKLFNQADLKGWYAYEPSSGKHHNAEDIFQVSHQMIRLYGKKVGYLMSEQSFNDFQLTIEFRWNTDTTFVKRSTKKNSGVMYMVPPDASDELWPKGIQFQVKEGATGDFILLQNVTLQINGINTEPGKSVVAKRFIDASKPVGEWNTIVITATNNKITQELNGELVNEAVKSSVWGGRVLLQYEGFPIDFRKVEIVEY